MSEIAFTPDELTLVRQVFPGQVTVERLCRVAEEHASMRRMISCEETAAGPCALEDPSDDVLAHRCLLCQIEKLRREKDMIQDGLGSLGRVIQRYRAEIARQADEIESLRSKVVAGESERVSGLDAVKRAALIRQAAVSLLEALDRDWIADRMIDRERQMFAEDALREALGLEKR